MGQLITHPTSMAQMYHIVLDAEQLSTRMLNREVEGYLVSLLLRNLNKPKISETACGSDYLESQQKLGQARLIALRDVADKCLLLAGLFPGYAERCNVSINYFIDLGRVAYYDLSHTDKSYSLISNNIIPAVDVMHAISKFCGKLDLSPIQAEDLWQHTGSQFAKEILDSYVQSGNSSILVHKRFDC